jgi:hypothetical protein
VAVGGREAAAGGAEGFPEGGGRAVGYGRAVADGDCGRRDAAQGAPGREGAHERVDGERLGVACEEVAGRAQHVGGDEEAAVGEPERDLAPAGEADDSAGLDGARERAVDGGVVAGGDRVGVTVVTVHQERDPGDRRSRQCVVEAGRVKRIGEQPAVVQPDRGRGSPQELVRVGEPREAPVLVEAVRLQGAGW